MGTDVRSARKSIAVVWRALALLLVVSACSPMTPFGNTGGERNSVIFHVQGARLACCTIVDLGGSGQLVVGRADYRDGRSRAWLARVSPTGHVEWQHELPLESRQSGLSAGATATRDSEAYVVGHMAVGDAGSDRQRTHLLVAKTRPDGNLHWMKTLSLGLDTKAETVVISKGAAIVVGGFVRAREGELRISEVFDGGERNTAQIALPTEATAFSAERTRNGELVAVGMFDQDSPNALRGWFLKVTFIR